MDTKTKRSHLGRSPERYHLPQDLSCSIVVTACGNAQWQSPNSSSLSFCLPLDSGATKVSPCRWHLSMCLPLWKRARRQQSRKKPCFPTGCRSLCLAEGQWFPHRFVSFSPATVAALFLVSTRACLLPGTHPKPSLPLIPEPWTLPLAHLS